MNLGPALVALSPSIDPDKIHLFLLQLTRAQTIIIVQDFGGNFSEAIDGNNQAHVIGAKLLNYLIKTLIADKGKC